MKTYFSRSNYDNSPKNKHFGRNPIYEDLEKTRFDLEVAYSGFNNAIDPDMIDSYIYEVNSIWKRYQYLLNQAAKQNLLPSDISEPETKKYFILDAEPAISPLVR